MACSIPQAAGLPSEGCVASRAGHDGRGVAVDDGFDIGRWTEALAPAIRTAATPGRVENLSVFDTRREHIGHLAASSAALDLSHDRHASTGVNERERVTAARGALEMSEHAHRSAGCQPPEDVPSRR